MGFQFPLEIDRYDYFSQNEKLSCRDYVLRFPYSFILPRAEIYLPSFYWKKERKM